MPTVIAPPTTTDVTVPSSFARTPDSNAPSSFDALMKTISTAVTRPRSSVGVTRAAVLERMLTLYMSTKPITARKTSVTGSQRDRPQTIVAAPNAPTASIKVGPAARRNGFRASTTAALSAPTAGAARNTPRPIGPTCRMSRA